MKRSEFISNFTQGAIGITASTALGLVSGAEEIKINQELNSTKSKKPSSETNKNQKVNDSSNKDTKITTEDNKNLKPKNRRAFLQKLALPFVKGNEALATGTAIVAAKQMLESDNNANSEDSNN